MNKEAKEIIRLINSVENCDKIMSKLNLDIKDLDEHVADIYKRSLLRRLQAQTLPDATPLIGSIYQFCKIAVTFEPKQQF